MASLPSGPDVVHVGMDTSMREIVYGVLRPGHDVPAVERIPDDGESVRRLVGKLGGRRRLLVCYEAGPSGYELCRLIESMGVACQVIAPSLVPKGGSERVKTGRRDAVRLTTALRAGILTPVRVPSPAEEAERVPAAPRPGVGRRGQVDHRRRLWVDQQRFGEPALQEALDSYRGGPEAREAELRAAEARLSSWAGREPLAPAVARLGGYRGIAELTALTLAAEVVDWRRFPSARAFMGFTGLVPAEYSSGTRTRRGSVTKAGPEGVRTALVESAWAYQHRPAIGPGLRHRQAGLSPETLARSWKAQQRLHATYEKMSARGRPRGIVVTAVARELAGFVWAEMTS